MDAYVFFDRRRTNQFCWWHLFVSKKWAHCLVLLDYEKQTLVCDCLAAGLFLTIEDRPIKEQSKLLKEFGCTAIVKITPNSFEQKFYWRGLITCVSVVKAALGIRKSSVLSPHGLFCYLMKNGGTLIFERK